MNLDNLAFVDIETTGSRMNYDRIIEIGILRVENNQLVRTYQKLINPEMYISPFIENITGIRTEDLKYAPSFEDVKDEILEVLDNCIFVAHNVRFDYGFIKNEMRRFGHNFSAKHFCTVKLSRLLYPEHTHHNLDAIVNRFNFICENRHRAFDDAKVLWDFYQAIHQIHPKDALQTVFDEVLRKPNIPKDISEDVINNLPEQPGVYIFYGEDNIPLYVGKSINIKDRVLSHFSNDHNSTKEMSIAQQLKRIETITTAGELGALLKEATLIKQLQPLYNRRLRLTKKIVIAKKIQNEKGYETAELEEVTNINPNEIENIIGIYRTKKQAKDHLASLAKEHNLCEKLLLLEKTSGACFGHKLERCKGACIDEETPLKYNIRFNLAFYSNKLKRWPFDGAIYIEEQNFIEEKKDVFVIDKWCLVDSGSGLDEIQTSLENLCFDLDAYKILVRYLFNPQNKYKIKKLRKKGISSLQPEHETVTASYL